MPYCAPLQLFHGVAERARQPGFAAVGERVAAHVDEQKEVAPERLGRLPDPGGDARRAAVRIDEDDLLAEELRHPRLREAHAAPAHARLRAGGQHAGGELARVLDLVGAPRSRLGVDRTALPGHPAQDRPRTVEDASRFGGR